MFVLSVNTSPPPLFSCTLIRLVNFETAHSLSVVHSFGTYIFIYL